MIAKDVYANAFVADILQVHALSDQGLPMAHELVDPGGVRACRKGAKHAKNVQDLQLANRSPEELNTYFV